MEMKQNPQNIFMIADRLQQTYKDFVKSFQKFKNPDIQKWVDTEMERKDLLYKDPLIELNFQFEKGKSLHQMVKEDILNDQIPSIFDITTYKHQAEAIEKICKDNKNVIISTGTGSGKSMCYWIPIVNTCLQMKEQGLDGIKAIVIFPMNALANSQYNDIVKTLGNKTKLKIGRYTGDTDYETKMAEQNLKRTQNRERYDCEYLSRDEMQRNPPDILITNYVMLDLILTRHEDKALFPPIHNKRLKFLVLDEIHTYNGNTGADVACLIRRIKQKTKVQGTIRCIGTSATIEDNKKILQNNSQTTGVGVKSSIVEFAEKIFGEKFEDFSLIRATHVKINIPASEIIPISTNITIREQDILAFNGQIASVIPLAEKILGRSLESKERSIKGLGQLFQKHQIILFLHDILKDSAKALRELAKIFRETLRPQEKDESKCLLELKAMFLIGTVGTIVVDGRERPLLVPKLHLFFTAGHEISTCLRKDFPHLSIDGELTCKEKDCGGQVFPLYFCRNCGQEYYSVAIAEQNVFPRNFETEEEGDYWYLTPKNEFTSKWSPPQHWEDEKGNIKKPHEEKLPKETLYCPKCRTIDSTCSCPEKFPVWKISYPFLFCPACEIFYERNRGEYGKLFSFNSTGRSSSTDILAAELLADLNEDQKKMIIFTDNRQDTALQAEHMNEFQRRLNFRRDFYHVLEEIAQLKKRVTDQDIGKVIYDYLEKKNILPNFAKEVDKDEFSTAPPPTREFEQYLTFLALSDIMLSQYFLDLNLEKLGLLKIEYDGLDKLATHSLMTSNPLLKDFTDEQRYDYLRGILDIFRWEGAIGNELFNNTVNLWDEWKKKLNADILFDLNKSRFTISGFAFEKPQTEAKKTRKVFHKKQNVDLAQIVGKNNNTQLVHWTKKCLGLPSNDAAANVITESIKILEQAKFIQKYWTDKPTSYEFYQIREGKIIFTKNEAKNFVRCPKCQRIYYFKKFDKCIKKNCPNLIHENLNIGHYYTKLYQSQPGKDSEIHAKEHSAQVDGKLRETFEVQFKETGLLNVLVCTPTMELGIDIGDLSAVFMRNVPPDPSRYAQRAGRAGRKNQPSLITVFCGQGYIKGPHDQYFYRQPDKIVSGRIQPPNFLMDNKKLIKRHIHASIFENLPIKVSQNLGEIMDLTNREKNFPLLDRTIKELNDKINGNKSNLIKAITESFTAEMAQYTWLTVEFIDSEIKMFINELDKTFEPFREDYRNILEEMDYLHKKRTDQGSLTGQEDNKYAALTSKNRKIKEGKLPYTTFAYLANYGFLPHYGFPSSASLLTMYDLDKKEPYDNWRSSTIAIREFAPHNQVYFLGNKYQIKRAMIKTEKGELSVDSIYICPKCDEIYKKSDLKAESQCPNCNDPIALSQFKSSIAFPHMSSVSRDRITCDEENRQVEGYDISVNYNHTKNVKEIKTYEIMCSSNRIGTISYEHNGQIYLINKGYLDRTEGTTKTTLKPFYFCSACGNWLHQKEAENHLEKCEKKATDRNLNQEGYWLFVESHNDVLVFILPMEGKVDETESENYYATLKEAILQSILLTYNLDESELEAFLKPNPGGPTQSIIIYETEEGGTGVLNSLLDPTTTRFDQFLANMQKILHIENLNPFKETSDHCEDACYNCLLRFRNQFEHHLMDRKLVIPLLQKINGCLLTQNSNSPSTTISLDELKKQCASELERMVLDEIVKQKLPLPDEIGKTEFENGIPKVKSDFFYHPNIHIFVDGPPHLYPDVSMRDQSKREFLDLGLNQIVVDLDFKDGKYESDDKLIKNEVMVKIGNIIKR
jgi:superfamily II DNA/RNA helicase